MQLLRHADDVPDVVGFPLVDAELDGREIGGGVEEAAVGLSDDRGIVGPAFFFVDFEGIFFEWLGAVGEYADCAAAFAGDSMFEEFIDKAGEAIVVVTFAQPVVEFDVEAVVNFLQAVLGNVDALLPDREVIGVAGLEFDELGFARIEHGRVFLGGGVDHAIDADQFGDRGGFQSGLVEEVVPAVNDHAELGAPVADVIVRDDVESEETRNARKRIADDGRADVADVHRLGDVGCREIDDHGFASAGGRHAEPFVADQGCRAGGVGGGKNAEIDEAGTGDVGGGQAIELEVVDDFLGQRAGIGLARLGENHGGVRLVIAKTKVGGSCYGCAGWFAEGGSQCGGKA